MFGVEAAAVAGERVVAADHSMTGGNDRNGISSVGVRYRPHSRRTSYPSGQLSVGNRRSVWNAKQAVPHLFLKIGAD